MDKKLFLLDGMALVYRAHFAFVARPIVTSKGVNTSALFGFTQTLLDILKNQQPTHIAVVFDTEAPTQRHKDFADYKAHRQAMPEELSAALPHVRRMIEAFNIPVLMCDGWEADDIIGTLARRAEQQNFTTFMVTPDKDFGQLVDARTFILRPSRAGDAPEILDVEGVKRKWSIQRPEQVIDLLGLMGDSTDNIPGVPGIGEKTASKLIAQFGTIENLLARTNELKGKLKETVEANREQALLSKRLATLDCNAPCDIDLEALRVQNLNEEKVKALCVEFEFNSIGKRLFGDSFKAGRGFSTANVEPAIANAPVVSQESLPGLAKDFVSGAEPPLVHANLKSIADVPHDYRTISTREQRQALIRTLLASSSFSFPTVIDYQGKPRLMGLAFSTAPHSGDFVPLPENEAASDTILEEFRPVFESDRTEKVGHDLKSSLGLFQEKGVSVTGKLFDTMVAHSLIDPDQRHSLDHLSEAYLGYTPIPLVKLIGDEKGPQLKLSQVPSEQLAEFAVERADVAGRLRSALEPMLRQRKQERVFYEVEGPLVAVLADMELEGIRIDATVLTDIGAQMGKEISALEKTIYLQAGQEFNLNSTRQLGTILFEVLKISDSPKKTKTGLYATDEQTLLMLASDHEIVQRLLTYRALTKLKSTYVDTLPTTISPRTGRVHTTYHQVATATGRLNSQNPNLQNIPIRTEQGKEIRKAFVPRNDDYVLLSADYSQIELRIIAALSRESGLLEAFRTDVDVHTATAARVFGVPLDSVTSDMRRKAKMVNYGIAYGISSFGLAQRLGIPRKEGATIIEHYFAQFPGIRRYMNDTIAFAREHGYAETVTGRRRYLRDIRSANATIRSAAERNAINAPIQGTAADMIKLAMIHIHRELARRNLKTKMLLQVHDELVFDLHKSEENEVRPLIEEKMKSALPLEVPIVVEMGTGKNWLEAH